MSNVPAELKRKEPEWLRKERTVPYTVGITEHAQGQRRVWFSVTCLEVAPPLKRADCAVAESRAEACRYLRAN